MSRSSELKQLFPILSRLSRMLDRQLTTRGKVVFGATLFFVVGSIHVDSPIYYLCGASLSLLLVSFFGTRIFRPALECAINTPSVVIAGIPFRARIVCHNTGQAGFDLMFRWLPGRTHGQRFDLTEQAPVLLGEIQSGESKSFSLSLLARQRGLYPCPPVQISSSFPFDLFLRTESYPGESSVLVAPNFRPLATAQQLTSYLARQSGESRRNAQTGDQEFIHSREYVPGVPGRRWDFRAWARTGNPHIRQHEDHGNQLISIVVDTAQTRPEPETFEAQMSLVMAIVDHLIRQSEQSLGGFAISNQWCQLPGDNSQGQWEAICRKLAVAEPTMPGDRVGIAGNGAHFVIFVATEIEPYQRAFLRNLVSNGCEVLPIVVTREPEGGNNGPGAAVALRHVSVDEIHGGKVGL